MLNEEDCEKLVSLIDEAIENLGEVQYDPEKDTDRIVENLYVASGLAGEVLDEATLRDVGELHLVAHGNAWDGMTLTGPFYSHEDALEWAVDNVDEYHIVEVDVVDAPYGWEAPKKPVKDLVAHDNDADDADEWPDDVKS